MNMGYIASTKQGSVLKQITDEMPKYGIHPICQTSVKQHNYLFNNGNPFYARCVHFTDTHEAKHIIDLATKTLHTKKCSESKRLTNAIDARIINAKTTGLTLCRCCK